MFVGLAAGCGQTEAPIELQQGAAFLTPTFIQVNAAVPQTPRTVVPVTYAAAEVAGDLNVVVVGWNDSTASVVSVVDTPGNPYQLAIGPTRRTGRLSQSIYYAKNIAAAGAGANTVTVTFDSAAQFPDVRIVEYRGVDPTNPVDVTAGANGNSTSPASGAVTTTNASDLIVGANVVETGTTAAGSGFTNRLVTNPDGDLVEDRVSTATGSFNATATINPSGQWVMQLVAFRAATTTPGDTQAPTAPSNLTATAASATQINLTWMASTDNVGVTSYLVERCQGAGCTTFAQIATTAATTFNSGGLLAQTTYSFRVRASDAANNLSAFSGTASATTQVASGPPVTPAFVQVASPAPAPAQATVAVTYAGAQAAGDTNVVVVGWNDTTSQVTSVSDAAGNAYVRAVGPTALAGIATQSIYYAKNVAAAAAGNVVTVRFNQAARFADVRVLEYRNVDLTTPLDGSATGTGTGSSSSTGSLTTTSASAVLVAANVVETTTSGPGSGFTSRIITQDGDIAEDRVLAATGTFSASAPLVGSGGWVMQMVALRAATSSADTQPPSAPSNLTATASSTSQIGLTWTAATDNVGVTSYLVERCQGAGCTGFTQIGTTTGTSFPDSGLQLQTTYRYRVRATDAANNLGAYSGTATATTLGGTQPPVTVTYAQTTANFANPERGFYHHSGDCNGADFQVSTIQGYRLNEGITLVMCMFFLDGFQAAPLSQTVLNKLQHQLDVIRSAGAKTIMRFAYTSSTTGNDAPLAQVLSHLDQLAPLLAANSDVIYVMPTGFIGAWGEGYYTQNFGNLGVVTPADFANRKAVTDKVLAVLPASRMTQLRTPLFKRTMYGPDPLAPAQAYTSAPNARIGHHNDCFLGSATDFGTYVDTTVEYPYLADDTEFVAMGGESCNPNPPRSLCPTALSELELFHWSYLNIDYEPTTLNGWSSGGCMPDIANRLGYRFALQSATLPVLASPGGNLPISITLRNDGWSSPFNARPVELLLRNTTTGAVQRLPIAADPRLWSAGATVTITQTLTIPAGLAPGSYALLLRLPDAAAALASRPEYSIQTANANTWDAATGANNLQLTMVVM